MKKNFLKIAALLIAAMLLVVSCSQEVKAPENDGLVEAKLSVGYGRELLVSGDTKINNIVLTYTMSHNWTPADNKEAIIGDRLDETYFTDGGNIGYVTPGLWTINVFAYEKDKTSGKATGSPIFEGKANAYISNQNSSVTVYLAPTSSQSNTLNFSITMQDLVGTDAAEGNKGKGSYSLVYTVYDTTGTAVGTPNTALEAGTSSNHVTPYTGTTTLASGFYRVNVAIISITKNEQNQDVKKTVGGISKGFLISGGNRATISGHIEPSDYENVSIDAVYLDVVTSLAVSGTGVSADGETAGNYKIDYNKDGSVTVKVTMTDTTSERTTIPAGTSKTLFWNTVSDETATDSKVENQTVNQNEKDFTFTEPGYKYITCTTVYKVPGHKVNEAGETVVDYYYFADSQTVRVFVDPTTYNNSNGLNEKK